MVESSVPPTVPSICVPQLKRVLAASQPSPMAFGVFHEAKGAVAFTAVSAYCLLAHAVGIYLLTRVASLAQPGAAFAAAVAGVLLTAHGRTLAAYQVHEAAHSSACVTLKQNEVLGNLSLWLCAPRCCAGDCFTARGPDV